MMPKAWYLKVTGDTETLGKEQERDHARRQMISHD